jgi:uncharacterized protein YjbI with pentapeptide repeats
LNIHSRRRLAHLDFATTGEYIKDNNKITLYSLYNCNSCYYKNKNNIKILSELLRLKAPCKFTLVTYMRPEHIKQTLAKHLLWLDGKPDGERANFAKQDLSGYEFKAENLTKSDFSQCILHGTKFRECDLRDADFFSADLTNADFTMAILSHADLRGSILNGAIMVKANLEGARMKRGLAFSADPNQAPISIPLKITGADLSHASLKGVEAVGADFTGTNLKGAVLEASDLSGADLTNVDLRNANLNGAVLSDIDFSGADLRNASLRAAYLVGSDLSHADLQGADLFSAQRYEDGNPHSPEIINAQKTIDSHQLWIKGRGGKRAEIHNMDLHTINFTGADLSGAICQSCYFSGADLRSMRFIMADLSDCDFSTADLSGAQMRGAILQRVNLQRANLSHVDLSAADVLNTQGIATGKQIKTNLSHADLSGANLAETNFEGVIKIGTIFED